MSRFWRESIFWMTTGGIVTTFFSVVFDGGFSHTVLIAIPMGVLGAFTVHLYWSRLDRRR